MTKIIDCFTFFNELKLLKLRLTELYDVVDFFVIVESDTTFSGNTKEFIFEKNKDLYTKFLDKIIYVKVTDTPLTDDTLDNTSKMWFNEYFQRNCIMRGIESLKLNNSDIIIVSDCDEIPDPDLLVQIKNKGFNIFDEENQNDKFLYKANIHNKVIYEKSKIFGLKQDLYYYNIECRCQEIQSWYFTKILTYEKLLEIGSIQKVRTYDVGTAFYSSGGWHFSYFFDIEHIIYKIESFSHQDLNLDKYKNKETIAKLIENCEDLYFGNTVWTKIPIQKNTYLPKQYELLL